MASHCICVSCICMYLHVFCQDSLTLSDILVNMLKKEKKRAADAVAALDRHGHDPPMSQRARSGSEGAVMNGHAPNMAQGRSSASPGSARRERGGREKPLSARDKKTQQKICKSDS